MGSHDARSSLPSRPNDPAHSGARIWRYGCRVPIPWVHHAPAAGFSPSGQFWLPQPAGWEEFSRDLQEQDKSSILNLYRKALLLRCELGLGLGYMPFYKNPWLPEVLAIRIGNTSIVLNLGKSAVPLPPGDALLFSSPTGAEHAMAGLLEANAAVWLRASNDSAPGSTDQAPSQVRFSERNQGPDVQLQG